MRHSAFVVTAGAILALAASSASAAVTFIGEAVIPGDGTDLSGLPSTLLEDGHSPQNALNGFGSGIAYAGGNTFDLLSDRGPNKIAYTGGAAVDNTTSFDNRYQTFSLSFTPNGPLTNGVYTSYTVNATNTATTLLSNAQGVQYQGISTGFSTNSAIENHRLDPEGIRVAPDGTTWISDEYGPYILHFNQQGQEIGSLALPAGFQIANPAATGASEIANNTTGRVNNKGAEGLAISPDGKTMVVVMQNSLLQDGGAAGASNRIMVYDLTDPNAAPKQYLYQVGTSSGVLNGISEILAVNNHQFIVDERDAIGGSAGVKQLYSIDLNQLTPPTDLATSKESGTTASNGLPATGIPSDVVPLNKTLFADIGSILNSAGNAFINSAGLPDKIEGYAWGPDLPDGRHVLLATNDNDFGRPGDAGYRPNYVFAFAVDSADVPGFQQEVFQAVPEPASLGLLCVAGTLLFRRKSHLCR